ncbi:Crp/Fnr family transcriptional regulator [Paenibacillus sp. sgz5001063]|uniref:Crp/Fnr family transcriptional regulator n=1 Tax=Paenibacillus sp. sgz5001063 TaxID=3242474 RepID=UPI0036D2ED2A
MKCDTCDSLSCVKGVPVFKTIPDAELSVIQSIIETYHYNKGHQVFREGEESDALFVVKSGLIKLTQCNAEGKQHVVRYLFPGDYFGQFALLHHKKNNFTAEIVESGSICHMRREDFLPLLEQNSSLAFSFLMSMSEQLQLAEETAGVMHMYEVEKRLARLLVQFAQGNTSRDPDKVHRYVLELPSAKKEIAAMIGTTAETLSRKLHKLIKVNIITLNNRKVEILDMDSLLRIGGLV